MELEPDEIRKAVHDFLANDPELQKLATGGVHFELAEEDPNNLPPYVIFGKPTGREEWCFAGEPMEDNMWVVKGVGTAKQAEAISKRCRKILNEETLTIENHELLFLRSETIVNMTEVKDGVRRQHVGYIYKLISERTN